MKSALILFFLLLKLSCACNAQTDSLVAYVFLSESCPICQNQTISLKKLHEEYKTRGVSIIGVFPKEQLSDAETINKFAKKYKIPFELIKDENQTLTKKLKATITPEVFLIRKKTQQVLYSGKVDNGFERVGKRRQVITEAYLRDALESVFNNEKIKVASTQPVGCFIN